MGSAHASEPCLCSFTQFLLRRTCMGTQVYDLQLITWRYISHYAYAGEIRWARYTSAYIWPCAWAYAFISMRTTPSGSSINVLASQSTSRLGGLSTGFWCLGLSWVVMSRFVLGSSWVGLSWVGLSWAWLSGSLLIWQLISWRRRGCFSWHRWWPWRSFTIGLPSRIPVILYNNDN